jgi:hypothetical protein
MGQGTQVSQSSDVILYFHDPTHEDTKGISLPQLSKINEINLEPDTKLPRHNGSASALLTPGDRILFHAIEARIKIYLDMFLCNIEILFGAIHMGPLLPHVTILSMPLINC